MAEEVQKPEVQEGKAQRADPNQPVSVSPAELAVAFAGPAVTANKVYLTSFPIGVRLAFCEQLPDSVPPQFRTAVFLSYADALSLRNVLDRQLTGLQRVTVDAEGALAKEPVQD